MYGEVHHGIKNFVVKRFGEDIWQEVLDQSGLDEARHFISFRNYDDDVFANLVATTSAVLDMPKTEVLEEYGEHFLSYCMTLGYDKILLTLGENLSSFIQNLDSLHALLSLSYRGLQPPSFRCETINKNSILLHYYSIRQGLYPIVTGMMKAVARNIFESELSCEVIEKKHETTSEGVQINHIVFRLVFIRIHVQKVSKVVNRVSSEHYDNIRLSISGAMAAPLTVKMFTELFPYYIMFDENLKVQRCGMYLEKMLQKDLIKKGILTDIVTILQPKTKASFEAMLKLIDKVFLLEIMGFAASWSGEENLAIKGQMVYLRERRQMMFIGSPTLNSFSKNLQKSDFLSEIPVYDVSEDLEILTELREEELRISKEIDDKIAELKLTSNALKQEKQENDLLLYQMLPNTVAKHLKHGKLVPAEDYENCTLLFSDIDNVTSTVAPLEIVKLLNQLCKVYDSLAAKYNVLKIQTKNDVYMVVGGVPEVNDQHAEHVACFALHMLDQAKQIKFSATTKPIQIRVGIHSGPVVAGIVGQKLPRYCLFGKTVDIASSMESQGEAGKVHCSSATYNILKENPDFKFAERGEVNVRGRGNFTTYFLVSGEKQKYQKVLEEDPVGNSSEAVTTNEPKHQSKICNLL